MRDVIWTIIAIWVVYQIYRIITASRIHVYQKHEHYHNHSTQKEGEIKIDRQKDNSASNRKPNSDKGGEYVDFEEIKE